MTATQSPRPLLTQRFTAALAYTVELFGNDTRKCTTVNYVSHLLGVCALVLADGGSEDEAIAALLHDTLEDKPQLVTPDVLAERFGPEVTRIVQACSDTEPGYAGGPKRPWLPRKQAYIGHLKSAGQPENRVALADKVDNARAILADYRVEGEAIWQRFRTKSRDDQLWFYRSCAQGFRAAGAEGLLIDELERAVAEIEEIAKAHATTQGDAEPVSG
jgi:(p)ppGpp synthase/HD superfamily hydrolase